MRLYFQHQRHSRNNLFYLVNFFFLGKTEEARADLARLAIIRKQREDAAKKRDEEKKGNLFRNVYEK